MSSFSDVTEAAEEKEKGNTPKGSRDCGCCLGHTFKKCMTVIQIGWGAILLLSFTRM